MKKFLATTLTILLVSIALKVAAASPAGQENSGLIPPLAPSSDETAVLAVPAWPLHVELDACLESAGRMLTEPAHSAVHVRMSRPFITLSRNWGYLLRSDFTRDDVAPPFVNRVLCWQNGQLVASKLLLPPLDSLPELSHPQAVPGPPRH